MISHKINICIENRFNILYDFDQLLKILYLYRQFHCMIPLTIFFFLIFSSFYFVISWLKRTISTILYISSKILYVNL